MMPMRQILPAELRASWTDGACGTLQLARSRPAERYRDPLWSRWGRSGGEHALIRILAPYLDLACQILGAPTRLSVHLDDDRRASGVVDFDGGGHLALSATTASPTATARLSLTSRDQSLTVTADTLTTTGGQWRAIPSLGTLRARVYREMSTAIATRTPLPHSAATASHGLATILDAFR